MFMLGKKYPWGGKRKAVSSNLGGKRILGRGVGVLGGESFGKKKNTFCAAKKRNWPQGRGKKTRDFEGEEIMKRRA